MRTNRAFPAALLAVLLVGAGCLAGGAAPTPTTDDSPTSTQPRSGATAAYVVQVGSVPSAFASADATVEVVLVERVDDLGPCYRDVYHGPYKPTLTPIATPAGPCHRPATVTVDLADPDANRTVDVTVPEGTRGHALVLDDLAATRANGSRVTAVKNVGGAELLAEPESPTGRHVVTLSIDRVDDDRPYEYWLTWETGGSGG